MLDLRERSDGGVRPPEASAEAVLVELPPDQLQQLLDRQGRGGSRPRKGQAKQWQTQLPLEIVSKGRFDKSEPTIHKGEDLDVPTYVRRGVALN